MIGRAKKSRGAARVRKEKPEDTHVVRIALTGGPCAGKSSALAHLRDKATEAGFDVYCAPEVATLLFNSGIVYPNTDKTEEVYNFQMCLTRMQLILERNMTDIVAKTGRPSIIIFDRGLLDAKGYMTPAMWKGCLESLYSGREGATGVTEEYCLGRYDGVLHLVTAADGAEEHYKSGDVTDDSGNTVVRREGLVEAKELDMKMRECWKGHPRHCVVENKPGGTFQDKLDEAAKAVLELAEGLHSIDPNEDGTKKGMRKSVSFHENVTVENATGKQIVKNLSFQSSYWNNPVDDDKLEEAAKKAAEEKPVGFFSTLKKNLSFQSSYWNDPADDEKIEDEAKKTALANVEEKMKAREEKKSTGVIATIKKNLSFQSSYWGDFPDEEKIEEEAVKAEKAQRLKEVEEAAAQKKAERATPMKKNMSFQSNYWNETPDDDAVKNVAEAEETKEAAEEEKPKVEETEAEVAEAKPEVEEAKPIETSKQTSFLNTEDDDDDAPTI